MEKEINKSYFNTFEQSTEGYQLPEKFTFPFYYEPHPLCRLAAQQLQQHLTQQNEWNHDFGLDSNSDKAIGKMFGVLVVQKENGEIGFLAAFSGKLAGENHHSGFVPPVFDMLRKDSFFRKEEEVLNSINAEIEALQIDPEFIQSEQELALQTESVHQQLALLKQKMKAAKKARKESREKAQQELEPHDYESLKDELIKESLTDKFILKDTTKKLESSLEKTQAKRDVYLNRITSLKEERKSRSGALQQKLFDQYHFLDKEQKKKSLLAIFSGQPPAGAGECAAPKLLQYAFLNDLKPIAMAEFWWGVSPKSEIRKHQQFYPACRGKCEPILAHMLNGIEMDDNPMLFNPAEGKKLDILLEDEHLVVINKPAEFLSVPGKTIQDSVYARMQQKYPEATGPLIVHRLDMSTSGIMVIAKTKDAHKLLQSQFIGRSVKKRYVALLDGIVQEKEGFIDLPLRVDLDNRPHQLVCYEYGKKAYTRWEVVGHENNKTRIHFYPITGRTHQLRVHAAHPSGLNTPIVGDDLYGTRATRLHLHAESLEFTHPITKEKMRIQADPEF